MKVYGWIGIRGECPPAPNGSCDTREICAVRSQAELSVIVGKPARNLFQLEQTGNREEIALALSKPGTIFWQPNMRAHDKKWREL